jgi:hypothetical protein
MVRSSGVRRSSWWRLTASIEHGGDRARPHRICIAWQHLSIDKFQNYVRLSQEPYLVVRKQAVVSLFFPSLRHRNSRIPAEKKEWGADNFLQKQQKQLRPSKEIAGKDVWIQ